MFYAPDIHRGNFSTHLRTSLPRIRIREGADRYLVQIECPEYDSEELELLIDRDILYLKGEKRSSPVADFDYSLPSSFQYRIPFNFNLMDATIKTLFSEGILNILISRLKGRELTGIRTIYVE
ncbi:MAG: Hsp20 family protein [Desulfohalobiaceae bacterium]|nr:Hsp20 family protein [Desulfohalobiaceae bacterium]